MYRFSRYNICLPLENSEHDYILMNGRNGAYNVVDEHVGSIIAKDAPCFEELLPRRTVEALRTRGYIIDKDFDEQKVITDLCLRIGKDARDRLSVTFIPGYGCNFSCPYCFQIALRDYKKGAEIMRRETVDTVIKCLERMMYKGKRVLEFTFFGGEPFLPAHKDIVEYTLSCIKKFDRPVNVVTNGYYLDKFLPLFKNIKAIFKITLDGTKEVHDARRSPPDGNSFDRITSNAMLALRQGYTVSFRTNVNRENIDECNKLRRYYEDAGFLEYSSFSYYFKATIPVFERKDIIVSDAELMDYIGNQTENYPQNSAYNRLYKSLARMLGENSKISFKSSYCAAHDGSLVFTPDNCIYSCWEFMQEDISVIGKVDTESGDLKFNEKYQTWIGRTVDSIPYCDECKYKLFCGGGCAAVAYIANGDINRSLCDDFPKRFNSVLVNTAKEFLPMIPRL